MARSKQTLGRVEMELLRIVAEQHPISVRDAAAKLAETSPCARTTALTMLERLRKKGFVSRKQLGGVNHYSPKVRMTELLHGMVGDFVDQVLGGTVSPFLAYLNREKKLRPGELDQLKKMVEEMEQGQDGRTRTEDGK